MTLPDFLSAVRAQFGPGVRVKYIRRGDQVFYRRRDEGCVTIDGRDFVAGCDAARRMVWAKRDNSR